MKATVNKDNSKKLKKFKESSQEVAAKIQQSKKSEPEVTTKMGLIKMAAAFSFIIVLVISLISSLSDYAQNSNTLQNKAVITENGKIIPLPNPSQLPNDLNPVSNARVCLIPKTVEATAQEAVYEQISKANELGLAIEVINDLGISFRFIPKGQFLMGSPKTEKHHEEVEFQHKAIVNEHFYMSKFEITEQQWELITGSKVKDSRGPHFPVVNINLDDAEHFIKLLNRKLNLPEGTYDLATETEWEYACRAWTSTPYFFGSDQDLVIRYDFSRESAGQRREIKGESLPNAWGLYNMIGNVGEWTSSPSWIYECPDNHYAPSWDKALYDGDKLGSDEQRLNNFDTKLRTPGIQNGIYYADELQTGKGQYSDGEFIWKDEEGGKVARYDHGHDTIIYNGGHSRNFSLMDGFEGLQNDLYYADTNKDQQWSEGEDIWLLDSYRRYANSEYVFRGGFWITHVEGCRSASRYSISRESSSNFIGLRIIRRLNDIKTITEDSQ